MSDTKLAKIYYGPSSYWKGLSAIKKLSAAVKVSEDTTKKWLIKTGSLANLSSRAAARSSSQIRCSHTQFSSAS